MGRKLNLFIRSFRGELSSEEKSLLDKLLEDKGTAAEYEMYRNIWDQAIEKGKSSRPDSGKSWRLLHSRMGQKEAGRRIYRRIFYAVAASAAAAVMAICVLVRWPDNHHACSEQLLSEAAADVWDVAPSDKIVVKTSAGKYYSVESGQAEITLEEDGCISINSVLMAGESVTGGYNRIKVPRGKMANLQLPDGSSVFLNSLSEITFPSEFSDDERMVYLSGEAYFTVAKDARRPFTTFSDRMNVTVLGTEFNFSASDESSVVTLVSGNVKVDTDMSESCILNPSQQVALQNGKLTAVKTVDIQPVICWKYRIMQCDNQNISDVFDRLSVAFDKDFICADTLDDIFISGKLDLNKSLDVILETISFAAPVTFIDTEEGIVVKRVK